MSTGDSPTVVLVHGAFADASSWNGVIEQLQAKGVPVTAPPNPLRGISIDSAYTASVFDLNSALVQFRYPAGNGEQRSEFAIDPPKVREAFAADLSPEQAALIGATQRPISELAFSEASGAPAWKKLPSWAVVASGDKAIGADAVRSMAQRAGAKVTEVDGSHVIMISQPTVVTGVILDALAEVGAAKAVA